MLKSGSDALCYLFGKGGPFGFANNLNTLLIGRLFVCVVLEARSWSEHPSATEGRQAAAHISSAHGKCGDRSIQIR